MGGRQGTGNGDELFLSLDGLWEPLCAPGVIPRVASGSVWELDVPSGMDGDLFCPLPAVGAVGLGWEPAIPPAGSYKAKEDVGVQCAEFAFKLRLQHI